MKWTHCNELPLFVKRTRNLQRKCARLSSRINLFNVLVEERYPLASDRLYYLGHYTAAEPHECIKGLLALILMKAKKLLAERYGDKMIVAHTY